MTQEEHTEAWRANVRAKAQEIQNLLNEVLALLPLAADEKHKPKFDEKLQNVTNKAKAMHDLYGPNLVPPILSELTQQLSQWKANLQDANITRRIFELWTPIGKIDGNESPEELSFTAILEKHKKDETLQKCLEELIGTLEQLLSKGDETLTSQAAKELERILEELKKRKDQSLFDIQPWIEFALVSTGAVVDTCTGTPVATIAAAAVIAAKQSQIRVRQLFQQAKTEYIESLQLKGQAKWESIFGKKLKSASLEEIQGVLDAKRKLESLPEPQEMPALPPPSSSDNT